MSNRLRRRHLSLENLEPRTLLAGDIQFAEPLTIDAGTGRVGIGAIHAVDVNNDDLLDLVAGNWNAPASVRLGNGDMTFGSKQVFVVKGGDGSSHDILPADLDLDGDLDLVSGTGCCGVFVVLNEGTTDGQWNGYGQFRRFDGRGGARASGDFDGDGFPDLAITRDASFSDIMSVLLNNGVSDGQWQGFAPPIDYSAGNFASDVAAGDFDNDGDLDLLVENDDGVAILMNSGNGQFADAVFDPDIGIVVRDVTGDGNLDVVSTGKQIALSRGNGDGTFSAPETIPLHGSTFPLVLEDFDNDGDLDIAAKLANSTDIYILANDGQGEFIEQALLSVPIAETDRMTTGDLDNDGLIDLVVAGRFSNAFIFPNVTGNDRDAVWDGDAKIGNAGDGTSWGDANNWSVDGVVDTQPASEIPGDRITFPAGSAETTIDLGEARTVHSVTFESDVTLQGSALNIVTGEVTVASDVTASLNSIVTNDASLTKKGLGTLVVGAPSGDGIMQEGTLRGTATFDNLTVGIEGTVSPGLQVGTMTVNRNMTVEGTLLIEFDGSETDQMDVKRNVDLVPGSTLKLQALRSLSVPGETSRTILNGRRINGTFTNEPVIGEHIGFGVFAVGAFGGASPVIYTNDQVLVFVFQAQAGDANGDRRFDQQDIVKALQGGKYLAGESAVWTEGDWNGDGTFDQFDIVAALATDTYLQ